MMWLVDTNVLSELRKKGRGNPHVFAWFAGTSPENLFLSVLVIGEIRCGVERIRLRDPRAARALEQWLGRVVANFAERILPIEARVAEEWGRLSVARPLPTVDGLLAATAKVHGLTLVTRNVKDVRRTGVAFKNPFVPSD
ncbi:MAG: type II toxin-antitoxin system VapC family toxin [Planctomycetes bacterium]|nr:type II toxin-antitoxin system VapC family toxin [Planctomycetota bacterium]